MPTATKSQPTFESLRSWLNEINGSKSAHDRGCTTHPSDKVPDGTEKPTQGAQSKDNEREVKKMIPVNVDEAPDVGKRDEEEVQRNIGLRQSETGGDPAVEDDFKDRPKDPGTTADANTSVGPKYSFDLNTQDGLSKAAQALGALANEIMADITTTTAQPQTKSGEAKQATSSPSSPSPAGASSTPGGAPAPSNLDAAQAGYELAKAMGLSKEAADATAQSVIENTIRQALYLGDRVGTILTGLATKKANEDAGDPAEKKEDKMPPAAMAAMGGDAPPDAGGGPTMGPGGPGGGDMGGGAGGPDQEAALQALAHVLMERGISPEELAQMIAGHGGGGDMGGGMGGGAPPMGGGAPPMPGGPPAPAEMGAKIAAAVTEYKRSGKFRFGAPKSAAEAKLRDEMHGYITEITAKK